MVARVKRHATVWWSVTALVLASVGVALSGAGPAEAAGSRTIRAGGTTNLAGAASSYGGKVFVQDPEFPKASEGDDEGAGNEEPGGGPAPAVRGTRVTDRTPGIRRSFEGLTMFDQRFANGGNQFSVEPPDQALCVGSGSVLESVNDVLRVYDTDGNARTGVVDLNTFYGYPAQFNRTTGAQGPFVTDPVCHYDKQTKRFYHAVLTLDVDPASGALLGSNHLDLAVSTTSDPTGNWTIYRIPVQDDGTDGTPNHHCAPGPESEDATNPNACIGDYPHLGADANGIFLTTNEYDLFGPAFHGAQVYALSKRALARGDSTVSLVQFDTSVGSGHTLGGDPGFTVWPAISPGSDAFTDRAGGTEFFLSSNAAEEAKGEDFGESRQLGMWALTNTRSLDSSSPDLGLRNGLEQVKRYASPPLADQKAGPFPLGQCINDTTTATPAGPGCWRLLFPPDAEPAHDEVISHPDANDTRMQQVVYDGDVLMGALDTAVRVGDEEKAGIEWFSVAPRLSGNRVSGSVRSGYVAVKGNNVTYPTVSLRANGTGVLSYTLLGEDHYPSLAYSRLSRRGVERAVRVVARGAAPDDGFTSYKSIVGDPPRTRWGDYGAAAVDGNNIWFAGEWIAHSCTFEQWLADPTCGGTRATLGNWSTSINQFR